MDVTKHREDKNLPKDEKKSQFKHRNDDIRFYSSIVSDRNKRQIVAVVQPIFSSISNVLEIGSSTGKHLKYFAEEMPEINWFASDSHEYLPSINSWVQSSELQNLMGPLEINLMSSPWSGVEIDGIFTANLLHILSSDDVEYLFKGVSDALNKWGSFVIYGPFIYKESFSIGSDNQLNRWLKGHSPLSGIKRFEDIVSIANNNGLQLVMDYDMPENYRILHFVKM